MVLRHAGQVDVAADQVGLVVVADALQDLLERGGRLAVAHGPICSISDGNTVKVRKFAADGGKAAEHVGRGGSATVSTVHWGSQYSSACPLAVKVRHQPHPSIFVSQHAGCALKSDPRPATRKTACGERSQK